MIQRIFFTNRKKVLFICTVNVGKVMQFSQGLKYLRVQRLWEFNKGVHCYIDILMVQFNSTFFSSCFIRIEILFSSPKSLKNLHDTAFFKFIKHLVWKHFYTFLQIFRRYIWCLTETLLVLVLVPHLTPFDNKVQVVQLLNLHQ